MEPARPTKRRAEEQAEGGAKKPKYPRFPGEGRKLDKFGTVPFSGRAQRLPENGGDGRDTRNLDLREKAMQRMRELGHQHAQTERKSEMLDRQNDLRRAVRRGGARGDVGVIGEKRKRSQDANPTFAPRRRTGARPEGPQRFTLG